MIPRLTAAMIIIALALCAYLAAIHWSDDRHPLLIQAADDGCSPPVALPNPCDRIDCAARPTREIA